MFNFSLNFAFKLILVFAGSISAISHSSRKGRLLGAKLITRNQINNNFQGSGSIAIAYLDTVNIDNFARVWPGVLIAKDTFASAVLFNYAGKFENLYLSELTVPYENNAGEIIKDIEGEVYAVGSSPHPYGQGSALTAVTFGPIPGSSKAVVATLPPNGSKPPPPDTKGCVVYGFSENLQTDGSDPSTNRLGYLPLIFKPFQECKDKFSPDLDEDLLFCATLDSPTQPVCFDFAVLDFPMVVACPPVTLRKQYKKEAKFLQREQLDENKKLCLWWWWWCQEEEIIDEEPWITVGILKIAGFSSSCHPPDNENDALFAFTFTGNLTP